MRLSAMSRCVSVTHSASREIGTQTSVGTMAGARPQRKIGQSPRGGAPPISRVRSSGRVVQVEGAAAEFGGDLAETLRLLGNRRLGAVEFKEQHRRFRQAELGMAG